jgi:ligand-binding sensor domain-containing protein/signal transduction histidine kinase
MIKRLFIAIALLALWLPMAASALDASRTIREFHHTAWTIRDGLPGGVNAITQTPDGYLWLGTVSGLYRFDGMRFVRFEQALPGANVSALAATASGDLWMGYESGGVSRLSHGHITNFRAGVGLPKGYVRELVVDNAKGVVWARTQDGMGEFDGKRWQTVAGPWGSGQDSIWAVAVARDGTVWAKNFDSLFYLRPGAKHFAKADGYGGRQMLLMRAPDGRIWTADNLSQHVYELPDLAGNAAGGVPAPQFGPPITHEENDGVIDRDHTLWGHFQSSGIYRRSDLRDAQGPATAPTDTFSMKDGLTSDGVNVLFEDREGDVWVGTNLGLDRFRAANVVAEAGIPSGSYYGYFTAVSHGDLYVGGEDALYRIAPGNPHLSVVTKLLRCTGLFAQKDGTLWVNTEHDFFSLNGDKLVKVALPGNAFGFNLNATTEDDSGHLLVAMRSGKLFRRENDAWTPIPIGAKAPDSSLMILQNDEHGGLWLGYADGTLLRITSKGTQRFTSANGPDIGQTEVILPYPHGVLIGGEFGIARFDGNAFQSIRSTQIPSLTLVTGIVQTGSATWFNGATGIVRMKSEDLEQAFAHPGWTPEVQIFDHHDGLLAGSQQGNFINSASLGPDGRLWFITGHGMAWIDPHHLHRNPFAPPVKIEALTTNGHRFEDPASLRLPKGTGNLEIDYAGLSLAMPDRTSFRYKLDGVDKDWVDPGTRRQAFYTNLSPGSYRFRVMAANNDGVWNKQGSTLAFVIPPTFLQSTWFKLICVGVGAALLWLLYIFRLRQITGRIRLRLGERLAERERIARELHDTLLQGFQGLVLHFQAVAAQIPVDQPPHDAMEKALVRADAVLVEGRDRVRHLRLAEDNGTLPDRLAQAATEACEQSDIDFHLVIEAPVSALRPEIADELATIGREAIVNAVRHADAHHIEACVAYQHRYLRMTIRDDGRGVPPDILQNGNREGHYGLVGMRERARKLGATFVLSSNPGNGTAISIELPAKVAFAVMPRPVWLGWLTHPVAHESEWA